MADEPQRPAPFTHEDREALEQQLRVSWVAIAILFCAVMMIGYHSIVWSTEISTSLYIEMRERLDDMEHTQRFDTRMHWEDFAAYRDEHARYLVEYEKMTKQVRKLIIAAATLNRSSNRSAPAKRPEIIDNA